MPQQNNKVLNGKSGCEETSTYGLGVIKIGIRRKISGNYVRVKLGIREYYFKKREKRMGSLVQIPIMEFV